MTRLLLIGLVALTSTTALAAEPAKPDAPADFAIRDGDTVVFLGDSITAARTYGKYIENYTLLRFPERKVRFINAGWGGDTAAGGLARLERDVFSKGATLVTVAYGINDIGWGGKADNEHRQKYLDSIRGIVEACNKRGVRVYICSAAMTSGGLKDDDYLQKMCDDGMAISRSLGGGAIDVQRAMRRMNAKVLAHNAALKDDKDRQTMHAPDGIHLSELGQLAMAFAILKGLGAPADVSSVVVDAAGPKLVKADGCTVDELSTAGGRVEFVRHDRGVPLNNGPFWGFNFRFVPIPEELNHYTVAIRNLPPGKYDLRVDDRPVSTYSSEDLARGVDITTAAVDWFQPGGPWAAQAMLLKGITDARHELLDAQKLAPEFIKANPNLPELMKRTDEINAKIEELQRLLVRPVPYRYVLQPAAPASQPK